METNNKETISEAAVEAAAEAAYEAVRPRMGFPTDFVDAPEPLKDTYRQMGQAALESGLSLLRTDADVREARAAELEDFMAFIRGPHNRISDRYTLRTLGDEAYKRSVAIRSGE